MTHYSFVRMATIVVVATLGCCALTPASESRPAQSAVESIPFGQMKRWLHFTRADIDQISVENGQLDFSSRFVYEGDYSLRWKYQRGDTLTWNCNAQGLGSSPTFYFTLLEPQVKGNPPSAFQLQFLDAKHKVACRCEIPLVRPFWNRCIIRLSNNFNAAQVGIKNLVGAIPDTVSSVRLVPLSENAGEVFLGAWIFTDRWILRRDCIAERDGFPQFVAPDAAALPALSAAETAAVQSIGGKLEESLMANWFNGIGKPYEAIVTEVMSHYQELHLRRTPEGVTAGRNTDMEDIRTHYWCSGPVPEKYQLAEYNSRFHPKNTLHGYAELSFGSHAYCSLMFDLANCYRRETDAHRRAALREMYELMFDHSQYLSGFPSTWFNGESYIESVFLMRDELIAAGRLDSKLLDLLRLQTDFNRIFLDRSLCNTVHPGDLGEDCDYTRLTSERIIHLALLDPNPQIRSHYLHAFQRWFSRIVLAYAPGVADTFKPDGSLNHHSGLQFMYGIGALNTGARVINLLSHTPFAIEPNGHALFKNTLQVRSKFCRNWLDPLTLSGKEHIGASTGATPEPLRLMALSGAPDGSQAIDRDMAAIYLRMFQEKRRISPTDLDLAALTLFARENIQPETTPQGHWTLGWSAAAIHRHKDWLLSVKGYSRYAYSRESGHPGYGAHYLTPHLGFGTIELLSETNYKEGSQYATDIRMPGFDWTKFPGTTDVFLPFDKIFWKFGTALRSDQALVGGVDAPNGTGVFVLSLHGPKEIGLDSFRARKSWFFFGDTVVCLGSAIQNTLADHETGTTLFQDAWTQSKDVSFPFEKRESLASQQCLVNRQQIGFCIFPGQQLCQRRAEQHSPDSKGEKEGVGKFNTVWLSHGKAPTDASYRYLMRMEATAETMDALARSMERNAPYEIHQQDDAAHIVASKPDATTGYVIFKADAALKGDGVASASRPCVITTHRSGAAMVLSIADPDLNFVDNDKSFTNWGYSQPSTCVITLHSRWKTDGKTDATVAYPNPSDTEITVRCKDGLTTSIKLMPVAK